MTSAQTQPSHKPPEWSHCGDGADQDRNSVGCRGIRLPGRNQCLAHASDLDRTNYLGALKPGADVDLRGTTFDQALLNQLLLVLRDPETGWARIAQARFGGATFTADAGFHRATFTTIAWFNDATFAAGAEFIGATFGANAVFTNARFKADANFSGATFTEDASFTNASFAGAAHFRGATFTDKSWFTSAAFAEAWFTDATFTADAMFGGAAFTADAWFNGVTFTADATFMGATFVANATFMGAKFTANAWFGGALFRRGVVFYRARFEETLLFGPLVSHGIVNLSAAVFAAPVTLEVAAVEVRCMRTQWAATATLRCRFAQVDLTDAVLAAPLAVLAYPSPFTAVLDVDGEKELDERGLAGAVGGRRARLFSVRGVDATHLVLVDIDLAECSFDGAFHLDKLRLEGTTAFALPPTGHRWGILRYSRRRTLAEEHYWRATRPTAPRGWQAALTSVPPAIGPGQIAALYRALRAALESRGDAPGAADFYYGEMEMRRHDSTSARAERALLHAYWLLSGYGLRASRALSWLLVAMSATILAFTLWGLPDRTLPPITTGTVAGHSITLHTVSSEPALNGPLAGRVSRERVGQAVPIVLNAVLFRATDQNLTRPGIYIDIAARVIEPSLLALAVLAVRGRVKR